MKSNKAAASINHISPLHKEIQFCTFLLAFLVGWEFHYSSHNPRGFLKLITINISRLGMENSVAKAIEYAV